MQQAGARSSSDASTRRSFTRPIVLAVRGRKFMNIYMRHLSLSIIWASVLAVGGCVTAEPDAAAPTVTPLAANAPPKDPVVVALGDQFVAQLPTDWHFTPGGWVYFSVTDCFTGPGICWGNNPSSPYGQPTFDDGDTGEAVRGLQLNQDEAVVIFLRTPPHVRYFAFSQYLFASAAATTPEFASLSDSLNNLQIGTATSPENPTVFNQYAVLVWTPDQITKNRVTEMLAGLNVDPRSINYVPMPVTIPGHAFNFGYGATADTFNMLMRTALPQDQTALNNYIGEAPFYVVKVGPNTRGALAPSPTIGYVSDLTGRIEATMNPRAQQALDMLVADITRKYSGYSLAAQAYDYTTKTGWDCIAGTATCAGDNHDALYSRDTGTIRVRNLDDFVIIAGVNHQKTGKATYINHSVYDIKKLAGIVGVADPLLTTNSALYHANVAPGTAKAALYSNLYAYMISYNCTGRDHCLQIPAPTPADPIGLEPGAPFMVTGRAYLEPVSKVRPAGSELIKHQVFVATKRR